ncbi:hypothetical protein GTR00_22285, partial [Kineococcus sp. T90]
MTGSPATSVPRTGTALREGTQPPRLEGAPTLDVTLDVEAAARANLTTAVLRAQRRFSDCADLPSLAEELVDEVHAAGYGRVLLLETVARSRHRELEVLAARGDAALAPGQAHGAGEQLLGAVRLAGLGSWSWD